MRQLVGSFARRLVFTVAMFLCSHVGTAENPDRLYARVQAVMKDAAADPEGVSAKLQAVREETGNHEFVRYAAAQLAAKKEDWPAVVEYVTHFPTDASFDVTSDWSLVVAAFQRSDFPTFEMAIQRVCRKLKAQFEMRIPSAASGRVIEELFRMETLLSWRKSDVEINRRILNAISELHAVDQKFPRWRTDREFSLQALWPADEPFSVDGYRAAVDRQTAAVKQAAVNRENSPELQRIRAIRDEQRYQVEIQKYSEGRGPGLAAVDLQRFVFHREKVEKELAEPSPFRDLIVPLQLGMYFHEVKLSSVILIGQETYRKAGVSPVLVNEWMSRRPFGNFIERKFDRPASDAQCRNEMRNDWATAKAADTATLRLRRCLLLAALYAQDYELAKELDRDIPVPDNYLDATVDVLAAVETEDDAEIPRRVERFLELLPNADAPPEKLLWQQWYQIVYWQDALDARRAEETKDVRAKLQDGLERIRVHSRESPEKFAWSVGWRRVGSDGRVKSLDEKRRFDYLLDRYAALVRLEASPAETRR